ncbi:ribosomal RNA small subunit methyltransferase B [Desulfosarcina widdelii]|uniref:16S rRNA (cytosine(967)-C(5))-methyltransferase n=1 Tax=Desulfosarcina widdelii TaxID=947919 RepID=A0A5K7YWX7_9BACT|nr:16S rRNA (cytosine(967)-C(5))-methyltransferase RsmB [Desulfosarcina widdelii]BBO72830.1 ribosomal RNA small subunit methyltransferase B [Desulfosarcina widdelii]
MTKSQHRPAPQSDLPNRPTADARAAALGVLERLDSRPATLDSILENEAAMIDALPRRDRALFNQLVYGVLRWRLRLDAVISAHASRPLKKIAPNLRNILRLGLFQIRFLDRIPASAAVNTTVALAKTHRASKAAGFVNAVLRSALREPGRDGLPDADADPVGHLSVSQSMPRWLVARWIDRLGPDEAALLCESVNTIPPTILRCNGLKNNLAELMAALEPDAERVEPIKAVPGALQLIRPRRAIHRMQAFADGRFSVQDGAAQLISLLLDPKPGETVLDACAGLGGKTTHLAQLMENQGHVVALDHVPAKLVRLEKEAGRMRLAIIETRRTDLNRPIDPSDFPRFDRILLDAPCSGLGVLRRNPDAKWSSFKKDIAGFARRQVRFLEHLAPLVKKQGTLVFADCSMEPEENESVVKQFLKKHPNFAISANKAITEKTVLPFMGADGFFRTAPHTHHMDGFFAARLTRMC